MIKIRKSKDRGRANHGWLDSYHTFSFANYYDPNYIGFRSLRVINEDTIAPGTGFGTHGHRNMEIITYVLEGAIEHQDSMGNSSIIRAKEVQKMSAGTGILHSEYNHSQTDLVHLLQIWIEPNQTGLKPSYEQKEFDLEKNSGNLHLIASSNGKNNSIAVHQDLDLSAAILKSGDRISYFLKPSRYAWLQVVTGAIALKDLSLEKGDGAAISDENELIIEASQDAEILLFDLA